MIFSYFGPSPCFGTGIADWSWKIGSGKQMIFGKLFYRLMQQAVDTPPQPFKEIIKWIWPKGIGRNNNCRRNCFRITGICRFISCFAWTITGWSNSLVYGIHYPRAYFVFKTEDSKFIFYRLSWFFASELVNKDLMPLSDHSIFVLYGLIFKSCNMKNMNVSDRQGLIHIDILQFLFNFVRAWKINTFKSVNESKCSILAASFLDASKY